ncbi:rhodanese-related sulfurtransferase [Natronospira proteinivora]|uniref:Rhodanese-related sulfurtransferase n=1 Tax=Natronospira proteinivora TaxID=1807133 RepID=A0ABT1G9U6_9GAMM|nr:rhodanese-like domain-containing protein [Natronospira proteinivora]MCP1728105.1 rhodanese-related sulfurtransferase [Natronospira proteinivora]
MDRVVEFASQNPLLVMAFITLLLVFIFTEIRRASRGYKDVETGPATRMINDGAVVIDVRQPDAYRKGHVAGAANYPVDRIEAHADDIAKRVKKAKGQPILIYDDMGMGAGKAAAALVKQELGVEIYNLKGGLTAWQRENLPLKKKG